MEDIPYAGTESLIEEAYTDLGDIKEDIEAKKFDEAVKELEFVKAVLDELTARSIKDRKVDLRALNNISLTYYDYSVSAAGKHHIISRPRQARDGQNIH